MSIVRNRKQRDLTYEGDAIVAVAGMLQSLKDVLDGYNKQLINGIPTASSIVVCAGMGCARWCQHEETSFQVGLGLMEAGNIIRPG